MAENRKKSSGGGDWSWPLIGLAFWAFWPLGLLLLFGKLFAEDGKKSAQKAPPLQGAPAPKVSAKTTAAHRQNRAAKAVKQVTKSPQTKKSTALWLKIIGAALLFFGINGIVDAVDSMLWVLQNAPASLWWLEDLLGGCAITAGGGAMLFSGFSMDRQIKRFSKYLLVLGDREAMAVDEIARTLGFSQRRVEKDLEKMIDKGYFGGKAYLNMELGYLFRGSGAEEGFRRRFEEAAVREETPPKETEEGYSGILRNIRRANDRIADPILSAKIDRLENITAKIFKAVEEDPKKAGRIDTFLNYYLPTTQKLLDSYAEFEAVGLEGEHLRQAKQRIEATMDSIVKGFEHQLDELYQADALDVDSDIRVMEHMLRRDTGGAEQDFGLGGSAVRTEED
ncbi:5-bromo-4-chloroindolyl phosphate hydrolysis family protein [Oscillospiraceae bacterium 38-13]